jgi:hypothetical protein
MSRVGRWLLTSLVLFLLIGAAYTWFTLNWSYSEGERAGVLQKFSKKGWLCKTYEGELALYIVGGVAPQLWTFTVRDAQLAEQMHSLVGRSLRLRYEEHVGVPTSCFGDTRYFVTGFEIVDSPLPNVVVPGSSVPQAIVPEPEPPAAEPAETGPDAETVPGAG